jgi:hypothetical protein
LVATHHLVHYLFAVAVVVAEHQVQVHLELQSLPTLAQMLAVAVILVLQ